MKRPVLAAFAAALALPVLAEEWRSYANPRYGYTIELPASFSIVQEAQNGDGITLSAADGAAELLVFGAMVTETDFAAEARLRRDFAAEDGWAISYERVTGNWASFSGSRGGEVIYVRGISLCGGASAWFEMTYPRTRIKTYDPVVARMVETLAPPADCSP